ESGTATDEDSQSGDAAQSGTVTTALPEDQARELADTNGDGTISDTPATTPSDHSDTAWVTEKDLLDFYMLDCTDPSSRAQGAVSDPDAAFVTCDEDGAYKYVLGPVDVKGANVDTAIAGLVYNAQGQSTGKWGVNLQFDAEGTAAFAEASQRLYDLQSTDSTRNRFAVVLDGNVITSPSMDAPITDGRPQISGNFTATSAKALANQLSFGSLPLDFTVQSEQQISATLGSDHLEKGIWAGLIGLLLVVAYMIWQYRGLAVLSAGSLLVAAGLTYLVITLLSWLIGYRLSLPGVAGLIVAVGITADSFIVYFERIRDEVRDGRPLVAAVDEGWERAKRTIIVSDLVNLIAALVLYFLSVGGVQGFAFTLGVTTIVDLVVIFFFTHPMMELLIRVPFFGEGHKLSGLDPEHLGAHSSAVYAGRGRVVVRGGEAAARTAPTETGPGRKSLAERRFEAAHVAAATGEADATDGGADETKELDR
ncbi:MAG: protein translocase subunit SecD, partial [Pauljensenia sp.]